jgi:hypothetical protein
MIELDMIFKTVKVTFGSFPNRKRENMFFSKGTLLIEFSLEHRY